MLQWIYGNVAHAPTGEHRCLPVSPCSYRPCILDAFVHAPHFSLPVPAAPAVSAEDFLERQRLAAGAKGCDNSVMACLAELADVWRQLAAATARKRHLQSLRCAGCGVAVYTVPVCARHCTRQAIGGEATSSC